MKSDYIIDYEMFNVSEIIKIINFFQLIEDTKTRKVNKQALINAYNEYRNILNNKSLEKKYDKMLMEKSRVSIYHTMKDLI